MRCDGFSTPRYVFEDNLRIDFEQIRADELKIGMGVLQQAISGAPPCVRPITSISLAGDDITIEAGDRINFTTSRSNEVWVVA